MFGDFSSKVNWIANRVFNNYCKCYENWRATRTTTSTTWMQYQMNWQRYGSMCVHCNCTSMHWNCMLYLRGKNHSIRSSFICSTVFILLLWSVFIFHFLSAVCCWCNWAAAVQFGWLLIFLLLFLSLLLSLWLVDLLDLAWLQSN